MSQKEDFLQIMSDFENGDVATYPNMIVVSRLHKSLVENGFEPKIASMIVGGLNISVSKEFIQDKDLFDKTIQAYTRGIMNVKKYYDSISPTLFFETMSHSKNTSLEYR